MLPVVVLCSGPWLSERYGIWFYLAGLIAAACYLYFLRDGIAASCAINQSECIGATAFQMIVTAGAVTGGIVGALLIAWQYFKHNPVKH